MYRVTRVVLPLSYALIASVGVKASTYRGLKVKARRGHNERCHELYCRGSPMGKGPRDGGSKSGLYGRQCTTCHLKSSSPYPYKITARVVRHSDILAHLTTPTHKKQVANPIQNGESRTEYGRVDAYDNGGEPF